MDASPDFKRSVKDEPDPENAENAVDEPLKALKPPALVVFVAEGEAGGGGGKVDLAPPRAEGLPNAEGIVDPPRADGLPNAGGLADPPRGDELPNAGLADVLAAATVDPLPPPGDERAAKTDTGAFCCSGFLKNGDDSGEVVTPNAPKPEAGLNADGELCRLAKAPVVTGGFVLLKADTGDGLALPAEGDDGGEDMPAGFFGVSVAEIAWLLSGLTAKADPPKTGGVVEVEPKGDVVLGLPNTDVVEAEAEPNGEAEVAAGP